MKILNDDNFEEVINNSTKPVLLDIYTEWCPPCKTLSPILDKLSEEFKDKVDFCKMDLDKNPKIGEMFSVDRIPTVILFVQGKIKTTFIGLREEEEIRSLINSNI
jgi:thioredoxin 1